MPLPAGTGMTRRSFLSQVGRARARRLRRHRALERGRARRRHRRGGGQRAREPEGARLDLPERRHRRAQRPLPGRRPGLLLAAADDRDRADARARRSLEDERLRWHPAAGGLSTLHAEGKVSVLQAVGYDNSDKSHFTARHYYEVGADRRAPAHRLARPLPRPGRHAGQPGAGAHARRDAASGDRDREGARGDAPAAPTSTSSPARASPRIRSRRRCSRWPRTSAPRTRSRPTRA